MQWNEDDKHIQFNLHTLMQIKYAYYLYCKWKKIPQSISTNGYKRSKQN